MAYAFSTQGATPMATSVATKQPVPGYISGGTPAARALNTAATPQIGQSSLAMLTAGGGVPKSQTITTPDGSSHTMTYQNPTPKTNTSPSVLNVPDNKGGFISGTPQAVAQGLVPQANSNPLPTPQSPTNNPTSFPGILSSLVSNAESAQTNPMVQEAQKQYLENAKQIGPALATVTNTPGLLANQNARASNVTQAYGAAQQGLASGIQQALAPISTTQEGLTSAAGLAKPSGNFPFAFNPVTGQFSNAAGAITGSAGGNVPTLTYNPQQDASMLATAVINNQIPYSDAVSALGYSGNVGTGLLQAAILAQGGNLANIQAQTAANQSNITTASTQTAGQSAQLQKAGTYALQTLQDLQNTYKDLGVAQTTSIPVLNQLATIFSKETGLGAQATQKYNTVLQEARAAVSNALTAAGNTPTFSDSTATALLPDNASPQQIEGAISQIQQLMGQKISTYGTTSTPVSGNQNQNGTSSSIYNF